MVSNKRNHAQDVDALLPLKPQDYQILLVLVDTERHGYGMVKEIDRQTGGRIRLEPGNLYRSVRRLIRQGLIAESGRRPAPESDDERRRYYRITEHGRAVLTAETSRLRDVVAVAEARLALSKSEGAR